MELTDEASHRDGPQVRLHPLEEGDARTLSTAFAAIGWQKPREVFEGYLREQHRHERWTRVAVVEGTPAGYVTLVWDSSDPEFNVKGIPEIMDLNVLPSYRKRGIGTALLDAAESEASRRSSRVGLRVGLHSGYGAAQRLYAKRGYLPDGSGAIRDGTVVAEGAEVVLDDRLTVRLTRRLPNRPAPDAVGRDPGA